MTAPTDRDLILRARRGDAEAFGEVVRRYQTSVFNVCYRMTNERREAEYLAQDTFMRIYSRFDSFDIEREFGRRASENGSLGTDHGRGSMMMVLGGNVKGGRVHGQWPGLDEGQLIGPGDLAVTTDYRDVLSEILVKRLNNSAVNEIFPEYRPRSREILK